ncbi:MAG: FHA domain-containing protein [Proteobacteria bacterium]|nr:FHA domain-containing protein [Pseudomonadota bacterium]MBU1714898.1 FHA domain-containing protein [Pseudomonadota bacterium]
MEEWVVIYKKKIVKRFMISEGECLTIGRGKKADVVIDNTALSRKQASLELKDGEYFLADLYSMNGTRVNGKKIVASTLIKKTDRLDLSKFTLKPVEYLTDEEESRSVVSVDANHDTLDKTHYLSGVYEQSQVGINKNPVRTDCKLTVLEGDASPSKISLEGKSQIKAGKDPASDLRLSGLLVGATQFSIVYRKEGYIVTHEAGFGKKTMVNGKKLTGSRRLRSMDVIQVGNIKIRFI